MTVSYTGNGEALSFIQEGKQPQVDVVTEVAVEKANWFVLSMRAIGSFFSGLWGNNNRYSKRLVLREGS